MGKKSKYYFLAGVAFLMCVICTLGLASLYTSALRKGQLDGCNAALRVNPKVKTLNLYCEQVGDEMWIGSMYTPELRIKVSMKPH